MKIGLLVKDGIFRIHDMEKPGDTLVEIRFTGAWADIPIGTRHGLATVMFRGVEAIGSGNLIDTGGENPTKSGEGP